MIMFAISTDSNWSRRAGHSSSGSVPAPVLLDPRSSASRRGRIGNGPQADLQHKGVTEYGRRGAGGIGVRRDIVGRQHEAVVDISGADDVLIDLVRLEIPSGGSRHHPVRRDLDGAGAKQSFAAAQI